MFQMVCIAFATALVFSLSVCLRIYGVSDYTPELRVVAFVTASYLQTTLNTLHALNSAIYSTLYILCFRIITVLCTRVALLPFLLLFLICILWEKSIITFETEECYYYSTHLAYLPT